MDASVEIWVQHRSPELVALDGAQLSIGRSPSNDVALESDPSVSRLHAVLEHYAAGWCVRDVNSANGTFVNGERLLGERYLHAGDEIRVGSTRIVFRQRGIAAVEGTRRDEGHPPDVTRREHDVLVALCRPLADQEPFAQPATASEIAAELVVTNAAVKFHLANLYDKFQIPKGSGRRAKLASDAILRGVVSQAQLRADTAVRGPKSQ